MTDTDAPLGKAPAFSRAGTASWPLAGIAVLLVAQFSMIFTRAINWDEYSYWREVAYFADGRLDRPLQTFHVRLFEPLAGVFATSTDHIVAARVAMFGFELVTLWLLYAIARRFADHVTALFVPLAYISAGYVLQHGFSFRVDPMATAGLLGALYFLLRRPLDWKSLAGFALCAAFAAMITIKVILYLPVFAGAAAWQLLEVRERQATFVRLVIGGLAAGGVFALLFWLHAADMAVQESAIDRSGAQFESSTGWVFFLGIPPYWPMAVKSFLLAPLLAIMVAMTPVLLRRRDIAWSQKAFFVGAWLPLLTLLFYKNTAAYYYVFLFAPLALACVPAIGAARARYGAKLLAIAFTVIALGTFAIEDRTTIDRQRQVEQNVHEVFGQSVTYFDQNFMLGDWPKANRFMTPWIMERYHRAGEATYRAAMQEQTVPLLLANSQELRDLMEGRSDSFLLPTDIAALRENYIAFSWPIWIAGKRFSAGEAAKSEEFLVPGPYTVRGGPVTIDGIAYGENDLVTISRGYHNIEAGGDATLVWGERLELPANPLEPGPIDVGF
jgi:hypothetical protein